MSCKLLPLLLLLATLAGCQRSPEVKRAVERVAILEFDNQSSFPEGAATGATAARIAALQLAGSPGVFAFAAASRGDAPLRRATQIVAGYLTQPRAGAPWTLHAELRDAVANRTLRSFAVTGASAGALADGVAAQLGRPGFAAAPLDLAVLSTAPATLPVGEAALARLAPLPAALPARAAAAKRLAELTPADSETAYSAANLLLLARQFPAAAEAFRRAERADPAWGVLHNEAAFSYALAGDMPAAEGAIEAYRKAEPQSANPSDSLGEIYCLAGRFEEAERAFLAAFDKDPAFFAAAPLRKAAVARRLAGPPAEADRMFARYASTVAKSPLVELEKAQWAYTSGRTEEALAALEAFAPKANLSAAWTQLSVWRNANGKGDAAATGKLALQTARTPAEQHAAVTALFASQPDAPSAEWRARAAKQFPPAAAALARHALIHALLLRKHWAEAIPLIAAARDATPPAQGSYWQALLAVALLESGQAARAKEEARFAVIPRTVGDASWDFLIYPKINPLVRKGS